MALINLLGKLGLMSIDDDLLLNLMLTFHSRKMLRQMEQDLYANTGEGFTIKGLSEILDPTSSSNS